MHDGAPGVLLTSDGSETSDERNREKIKRMCSSLTIRVMFFHTRL